eukprot:tig00020965_g16850.t1
MGTGDDAGSSHSDKAVPKCLPLTGLPIAGDLRVHENVLVCGDPARATRIAQYFHGVLLSENREYRAYSGTWEGLPVTVCSHGIGAPGASIAFEELIRAGAKRLIRVGTCGSLQQNIHAGDVVIATAAVDSTGYGRETVPPGFPAVSDPDIAVSLRKASKDLGMTTHTGLIVTRDAFYRGVESWIPNSPSYQLLSQANVLCVEMECSSLFIIGSLRKVQVGAILAVDGNVLNAAESMDSYKPKADCVRIAVDKSILIALNALRAAAAASD